jgi:cyclophilin family peptidyl-prolyl cis-trans isomerase
MKTSFCVFVVALVTLSSVSAVSVTFETTMGRFTAELDQARAPITTANILKYIDSGFYAGTIFHRVIPNFMVQGGGFTADMQEKETRYFFCSCLDIHI